MTPKKASTSDLSAQAKKLNVAYQAQRLRREKTRADREEREEQLEQGRIVARADVVELVHQTRERLSEIGSQSRKHLCRKCQKQAPDQIAGLIEAALLDLSRMGK